MDASLGSQWGKWDLHFHTPSSYDYRGEQSDSRAIVETLVGNGVVAVAITDHHRIDVKRIRELQEAGKGRLTVFPGIEFRCELGGHESVHYIGVFPETADIESIWTSIQGTLSLTPADQHGRTNDEIYVPFEKGATQIRKLSGLVSVHAGTKSNSFERIPNNEAFKRAFKTDALTNLIDLFEIGRASDASAYQTIVFPSVRKTIPLVVASDSHNLATYDSSELSWIKALPTFFGLRQLLNEPTSRVCNDAAPAILSRVDQNRTRYVRGLSFGRTDAQTTDEQWFDGVQVELSPGLVAVIGNKGSGKSALTDTLGLLGSSRSCESFSFLSDRTFLKGGKRSKAASFNATLTWASGDEVSRDLTEMVDMTLPETIKYLPQQYLETVCNELSEAGKTTQFDRQLRSVIFSHVPPGDALGRTTLDELLDYLTDETKSRVAQLQGKLAIANAEILDLEYRSSDEFRRVTTAALKLKKEELAAFDQGKPPEVPKPAAAIDPSLKTEFNVASELLAAADTEVATTQTNLTTQKARQAAATRFQQRLHNYQNAFEELRRDSRDDLLVLACDLEAFVTMTIDLKSIAAIQEDVAKQIGLLEKSLDPDNATGLMARRIELQATVTTLAANLDAPSRLYNEYLLLLQAWQEGRAAIVGDELTATTVAFLEAQLRMSREISGLLSESRGKRDQIVREIVVSKLELVAEYQRLNRPIQMYLSNHKIATEQLRLGFEVAIADAGVASGFFQRISQGRRGSYCGVPEGRKRLQAIIDDSDFHSESGVLDFLAEVLASLSTDQRTGDQEVVPLAGQLKDADSSLDFYNWLFGLDYLEPRYQLTWMGKDLTQLSPGERGAVLLVFYLLLDKSTIPLVVDQPEENLDNQSVYEILVNCIRDARSRRQVIMVTHNPNIAVVCDAEQVVYAEIDKAHGNRASYVTGAIEDPAINRRLIDVLEGTRPAFEKRDAKYRMAALWGVELASEGEEEEVLPCADS